MNPWCHGETNAEMSMITLGDTEIQKEPATNTTTSNRVTRNPVKELQSTVTHQHTLHAWNPYF